ncbi:MAG: glycosyltransferase [Syntrophales bacterium]|nr:glycosyltransferase [Syntrophales bacterium]MDD5232409.1 glycosyltransferase [Syntrophales bacterium]
MRIAIFCHSILSDWNHGNAHFLRGVARELSGRGHDVSVYEEENAWSVRNLVQEHGASALSEAALMFPELRVRRYRLDHIDLEAELDRQDLAIVHEWNPRELVTRIGMHRAGNASLRVLFHDTHHRSITEPDAIAACDLSGYDGVLAFGESVRQLYLARDWAGRVFVWHEAADTRLFRPHAGERFRDLVWIGNWGDGERSRELEEFLVGPVRMLNLKAAAFGVRYPDKARTRLKEAGLDYEGWIPNYRVPEIFSCFRAALHVPRRPYVTHLRGIPTIRVFEALACGIPLICSPWEDTEGLFRPGRDFLIAQNGSETAAMIFQVLNDPDTARSLSVSGLETVLSRHTCAHRVDQLMHICREIGCRDSSGHGEKRCVLNA